MRWQATATTVVGLEISWTSLELSNVVATLPYFWLPARFCGYTNISHACTGGGQLAFSASNTAMRSITDSSVAPHVLSLINA